ncbi:DUF6160 family protein [Alcanivorax jadensis]|jgi:hypothetical protein|nr:DUF6160 family protein [Alcanivorax jadensis]|tara:strand:+ start:1252 stop:3675 length:2424 start_codon:yes stop_codon:yes gene_type:complete
MKKRRITIKSVYFSVALPAALLASAIPANAMQALDDKDLAGVSGQDGLTINLEASEGWSADAVKWKPDATELSLNNINLDGVGDDGTMAGADQAAATFTVDAGTAGDGVPLMALGLHTDSRIRVRTDSLTIPSASNSRSMGTFAFDFEGGIDLVNNGIFNMGYDKAYLLGEIRDADLFYRQGDDTNPWLALHDFALRWEIQEGTLGVDNQGIVHRAGNPFDPNAVSGPSSEIPTSSNIQASDLINLALDFDLIYGQKVGAEEFRITNNARGLMHFGFLGSVRDAELKWMSGGVWQGATAGAFDPYGANAVTSEGLRFSSQWDYVNLDDIAAKSFLSADNEFRWRLGETADVASLDQSRVNFELGDWTMWGVRTERKPSAHYFPLIAIDVINGAGQGPGGLCWGHGTNFQASGCAGAGGQFMNIQPGRIGNYYGFTHGGDSGALAIVVRDGQLQAYSRKVRLLERQSDGETVNTREFNWGLIYSLANIDANFYLYPGGSRYDSGSASYVGGDGIIADILLKSQTLDASNELQTQNWDHGTHLMIADTEASMGIGFMSSSFVVAGNDTRIWVKPQVGNDYYSGGLDIFSPEARFNYRATFGGGLLPGHPDYDPESTTRAQTVNGANLDLNLEGLVNLRFSPSDPASTSGNNYLGYSGALSLGTSHSDGMLGGTTDVSNCGSLGDSNCGSYLSIAEPSQPEAAIKLANITGDLAFTDGRVDIVGTNERAMSPEPKMIIANNIKVGYAAATHLGSVLDTVPGISSANAGQPVIIDSIMLGDAKLGRMVIPSAQIYSSITLEPQSAAIPFSP